jgi:hypothetical protein
LFKNESLPYQTKYSTYFFERTSLEQTPYEQTLRCPAFSFNLNFSKWNCNEKDLNHFVGKKQISKIEALNDIRIELKYLFA